MVKQIGIEEETVSDFEGTLLCIKEVSNNRLLMHIFILNFFPSIYTFKYRYTIL